MNIPNPQPRQGGDPRRPGPSRWARGLAWVALFAALHQVFVFLSVTLESRDVDLWFFFSSDTVQYGLLYKDLFDLGFHYAGWNISHAPEYLQMAWALLLRALTPSLSAGHVLEALTQPLLLALALHALFRRALGRASLAGPLAVATLLTLIARGRGLDFIAFIWSNRHGFTALIAALALSRVLEPSTPGRRPLALLTVLTALGTASDLLFVVWFSGPALLAAAIAFGRAQRAWAIKVALAIAGGTVVGLLAFWILTPVITVGEKIAIDPARAPGAFGRMVDDAWSGSSSQNLLNAILGGGLIVALGAAGKARRVEGRYLAVYSVALTLATIAAMALTSAPFREAGYTRYLAGPELAALCAVILGFGAAAGETVALLVFVVFLIAGYQFLPPDVSPVNRYQPPLARCVDSVARKHGLQYGVADYWLAKYLTAFSSVDLSIVPVTPRLDPFLSFANSEWFLGGVGAKRHDRPVYTFAILGSMTPEQPGVSPDALKLLGPPVAVETCYGFSIHILPAGSSERIRAQFAQNKKLRDYYAGRGLSVPAP